MNWKRNDLAFRCQCHAGDMLHQSAQICDECRASSSECQAPTRSSGIVYIGEMIEI
jgi:hypothetical protein